MLATISTQSPIEQELRASYTTHFQQLIDPFYQRVTLIKADKLLEAVSMKPSGIWYANTYAVALKLLGNTPIPVEAF